MLDMDKEPTRDLDRIIFNNLDSVWEELDKLKKKISDIELTKTQKELTQPEESINYSAYHSNLYSVVVALLNDDNFFDIDDPRNPYKHKSTIYKVYADSVVGAVDNFFKYSGITPSRKVVVISVSLIKIVN